MVIQMVIGKPDSFSVLIKKINSWNTGDGGFCNGILLFSVNGRVFPDEFFVVTLSRAVFLLRKHFQSLVNSEKLFLAKKEDAFQAMYNASHPIEDNDIVNYNFDLTPEDISDRGYFMFAVQNGNRTRIMVSNQLKYEAMEGKHDLNGAQITETIISNTELEKIIEDLSQIEQCIIRGKRTTTKPQL